MLVLVAIRGVWRPVGRYVAKFHDIIGQLVAVDIDGSHGVQRLYACLNPGLDVHAKLAVGWPLSLC